jgi:ribosomal protein L7/L12
MRHDSPQSTDLPQAAVEALWKGHVIEAMKIVRRERDIELKESKDQVDALVRSQQVLQRKLRRRRHEQRKPFSASAG